jgi:hypothetical protein
VLVEQAQLVQVLMEVTVCLMLTHLLVVAQLVHGIALLESQVVQVVAVQVVLLMKLT